MVLGQLIIHTTLPPAPPTHPTCLCFVFVFLSFLFFQSALRGRVVAISDAADDNITAEGSDAEGGRLPSSKPTQRLEMAPLLPRAGKVTWTVTYSDGSTRKYTDWLEVRSTHFSSRSPGGTSVGGKSVHLYQVFRDVADDYAAAAEVDNPSSVKKARPPQKAQGIRKKRRWVDCT